MANKIKPKAKLPTAAVIGLAATTAVIVLIIAIAVERTLFAQIKLNTKVIGKKQTAEKHITDNLKAMPGLSQEYQALGDSRKSISAALPETSDFPALVAMMEVIAGNSSVQLLSVSPSSATSTASGGTGEVSGSATTPSQAVSTINANNSATATSNSTVVAGQNDPVKFPFDVKLHGKYTDLVSFMAKLQLSARPIKISSLKLTGQGDQLDATFELSTFYYKPTVLNDKTEVVK